MIVLDASAMVEWLLRLPHADDVERELSDPSRDLHAPHLLDAEVLEAPLLTLDAALAVAPGHDADVRLIR